MEPKRKTTIYDVAAASGASASTVGAVLNGTWAKRRISKDLADRVLGVANHLGYRQNRQASALRTQRSGLIGMILPLHDNRYFSSLSQAFEAEARQRDLCPMVVSTLRDPALEKRTVATLLSHNVDLLLIAGATDPDPLSRMCGDAGIPHINVDLPGALAASVVTDSYFGATELTRYLMNKAGKANALSMHFIGGINTDFNTTERVRGFRDAVMAETGTVVSPAQVDTCGYGPDAAEHALRALLERLGALPKALFVNSTIAFEGVFRVLKELTDETLSQFSVGCFDWDPFLSHLHFPVAMVRQDAQKMIETAFKIIEQTTFDTPTVSMIKPDLLFPAAH